MHKIKNQHLVFPDKTHYKIDYSDEIVNIICKLLKKDRKKRLGAKNDAKEILAHPFFQDIDLEALERF